MQNVTTKAGLIVPVSALDGFGAADSPYRSTSRFSGVTREWRPSRAAVDEALLPSLGTLRDQSRDLDRNEPLARGAAENYVTNVIGMGLRPQARVDHELLGISEERAREFERKAEKLFDLHMSTGFADFHGKANFPTLQAQIMRSMLIDGDCLVVRRYRERPWAIMKTCLQVIDGSRLQNPSISFDPDRDIREGVELDRSGMPIAYHIASGKPFSGFGTRELVRVPRFDRDGVPLVLHVFSQRLPGQSRGEPLLAPVVEKFKQLSRYTDAEIMAAVINAFYATFITSETGGPFPEKTSSHLAKPEEKPRERQTHKFGEGLLIDLLPGEKVDSPSPGRPNVNFDAFMQAIIKQISIGLGIPYEVYVQHFQSSYTAARGAFLEAWKKYRIMRKAQASEVCQPIYQWIIADAVRDGLLDAPGFDDPMRRMVYTAAEWIGSAMESIDPLKDAKADELRLMTRVASRRSIVEEAGKDFDKLNREIEEDSHLTGQQEPTPGDEAHTPKLA